MDVAVAMYDMDIQHGRGQAELVVAENGKNKAEALASVAKGNETVEWACSMPQLMQASLLFLFVVSSLRALVLQWRTHRLHLRRWFMPCVLRGSSKGSRIACS